MTGLVVGDVISGQIAFNGFYEYQLSLKIRDLSKQPGLFIDVGANLGYFTLLWLDGSSKNTAIAIEASPRNQQLIIQNLEANQFQQRVELIPLAAGNEQKNVRFDLGPEEQTGWGGMASEIEGTHSLEVEMFRIDQRVDSFISVMKVDVEGADTLVILGCENLLREKKIGTLFFEQNEGRMEKLGIRPGEAQEFLSRFGYRCEKLASDEWMATPDIPNQAPTDPEHPKRESS